MRRLWSGLFFCCFSAFFCGFPVRPLCAGEAAGPLKRVNQALRIWLERMQEDRLYLLIDRQEKSVRLYHGEALLREGPLRVDALGEDPGAEADLVSRIRRYRPGDPWTSVLFGPFDWERNLVEEGTGRCALYFSSGVLIYASDVWEPVRPPAVKIREGDLRVLYEACAEGTPLVVLPAGWNEEERDERR